MKYILLAIIAIVAIQCQPATNPSGAGACAATYTCVPNGNVCGNVTNGADTKKYCALGVSFCDYLSSGKCVAKYATNAACNSSYGGLDCISAVCTAAACAAPATTAPPPTVTLAYETGACASSGPYCAGGLSCVNSICQKYYASAVGSACNTVLDCTPGNVCVSNLCAAQTSTAVIGASCAGDTDCNSQTGLGAVCICNSVGATGSAAGTCGVLDTKNGLTMTASAVTNCAAFYNQYKNMGSITSSNTASAVTNFGCVQSCAYTHGPSTVTAAWAGYNYLTAPYGTITNCVYSAPSACAAPTTTGATTKKASATSVVASLFLTVLALLF